MAKKASSPTTGKSKTSAKGAHGGGVKFSQISLGPGFKVIDAKGIGKGKSAAKLPKPKNNISESFSRPSMVLGKGFGTNPYLAMESQMPVSGRKISGKKSSLAKSLGKRSKAGHVKPAVKPGKFKK